MLSLIVENLTCASCVQRIERALSQIEAIRVARVNLSTHRLRVIWDDSGLSPQDILTRLAALGFQAKPFDPNLEKASSDTQEQQLLRALGVAGFAAANVMLISVAVWAGLVGDMGPATRSLFHWISALIVLPTVAYSGQPFFRSAWLAVKARRLNMDVPISLAVLLASAMSVSETIANAEHVYFDAAAMLLFFLLIGRYLDRRARAQANSVAQNLLALRTSSATIIDADGHTQALPIEDIQPGMTVLAMAGERLPVDGKVIHGQSDVDASSMTGESLPQKVKNGSQVFAGTLNLSAPLQIEVSATDENTVLSEIVRLMENAEQGRAKYVRLADQAAQIYAPAVHGLAALTFVAWWLLSDIGWQASLFHAIAVLIITCPCALGLAVPVVQVVAVGQLLKKGVLAKVADGLERLAMIDTVVFDKTGTLTTGDFELVNKEHIAPDDFALAASMAAASKHPLSKALVSAFGKAPPNTEVSEHAGSGLIAHLPQGEVRLGSRAWVGLDMTETQDHTPYSEIWLKIADRPPVAFLFQDTPRMDAAQTIAQFQKQGLDVALLSGDRRDVVAPFAASLGIKTWQAQAQPQDKIAYLNDLRAQGHKVLMVGDGLNDAPALAAANVSLSPSSASDISQAAADFVFQGGRLSSAFTLYKTAKLSRRLVMQNFGVALIYNIIAVPLAMAGFVTPLLAAAAMSASSILVTLNAMRLYLNRQEQGS